MIYKLKVKKFKKASFIPQNTNHGINNGLFKKSEGRDNILEPYSEMKKYFLKKKIQLNTLDINTIKKSDYLIVQKLNFNLLIKLLLLKKLNKTIYFQYEPPVVMGLHSTKNLKRLSKVFAKVLTWNDDLVDNKIFFKVYTPMPNQGKIKKKAFKEKKLLTNVSSNKYSNYPNELYSKRIEAIKYFEKKIKNDFALYGMGWTKRKFPSYQGKIESKWEILKNYKFSLCYENICKMNGYITEKIFDCFYANTIPIYWGAENIAEYIPKTCYIDKREFDNYDELYKYISNMTEKEYNTRIDAINKYLRSGAYSKFLPDNFSAIFYNVLTLKNEPKKLIVTLSGIVFFMIWTLRTKLSIKKVIMKIKKKLI